jgi:type IV secretory pathway component VirB8
MAHEVPKIPRAIENIPRITSGAVWGEQRMKFWQKPTFWITAIVCVVLAVAIVADTHIA